MFGHAKRLTLRSLRALLYAIKTFAVKEHEILSLSHFKSRFDEHREDAERWFDERIYDTNRQAWESIMRSLYETGLPHLSKLPEELEDVEVNHSAINTWLREGRRPRPGY